MSLAHSEQGAPILVVIRSWSHPEAREPIASGFDGANTVYPIDLDDDGDQDVLGSGAGAGIAWWEAMEGLELFLPIVSRAQP